MNCVSCVWAKDHPKELPTRVRIPTEALRVYNEAVKRVRRVEAAPVRPSQPCAKKPASAVPVAKKPVSGNKPAVPTTSVASPSSKATRIRLASRLTPSPESEAVHNAKALSRPAAGLVVSKTTVAAIARAKAKRRLGPVPRENNGEESEDEFGLPYDLVPVGSPSVLPDYAIPPKTAQVPLAAPVVIVAAAAPAPPAAPVPLAPRVTPAARVAAAAPVLRGSAAIPRATSKTLDCQGQPLSHADLKKLVSDANAKLAKADRSTNVAHMNISQLDDWLVKYNEGKRQSAAMLRVTAAVKVEVCMRMLALLADMPELLALFQEKCGGSSQHQIDAGGNQLKNTGQGMNLNHAYWPAMVNAFNDSSNIPVFPFEYVVDEDLPTFHSNGIDHVLTPARVKHGFFSGLGIRQPRIPEGFYDGFFDIQRLDAIFVNGMAEYHNAETNFHQSGQHGKPLWFFVQPCRTQYAEEQALHLDDKMKRWDSLAFDCFKNEIQQVKMHFTKTVPNGVGGAPSASQPVSALPPGTSQRVTAATRQQLLDSQSNQLHELQMQNLQAKANARTKCDVDVVIGMLDKIRKLQVLADDFKKIGSTDMEDHCIKQVDALKAELLARDLQQHSPVTFGTGQGGNTPRTPVTPHTHTLSAPGQGGSTPRTPVTPLTLTLSGPGTPVAL